MSKRSKQIALAPDVVYIWLARPDDLYDRGVLQAFRNVMSGTERVREERFRRESDRRLHRATRGLVRNVLSMYAPVPADLWEFTENRYGRPAISAPAEYNTLKFNLSHTAGLAACAVTVNREIGVDVERIDRTVEVEPLAKRCFAPEERADLFRLTEEEKNKRFFAYWTLKESYIKAKGVGLSLSTSRFAFSLRDGKNGMPVPTGIRFDEGLNDNPDEWRFVLTPVTPSFFLAMSVRTGKAPVRVIIREFP